MILHRRDFFKVLSVGVAAAASTKKLHARDTFSRSVDAVGLLYDSTLCIGCKACEVGCKTRNGKPAVHSDVEKYYGVEGVWDAARDLDIATMNKIKLYKNGTAAVKDREKDGFAFIKRACMHCVDPDCQSACPTSALKKDPVKGYVTWNKDACCGCRYCQVACQYLIPKFEYDKPLPELVKCELCYHTLEAGGITGCAEWCPTGATIYGRVDELLKEAQHRLGLKAGDIHKYQVCTIDAQIKNIQPVANYVKHVYGEKEGGGTQYLLLSAIPFEDLGLPTMPEKSGASKSETLQHTLYKGLIGPVLLLAGLATAAYRSTKNMPTDE